MTTLFKRRERKAYDQRGQFADVIEALEVGQSVHVEALYGHFSGAIQTWHRKRGRRFKVRRDGIVGFRIARTA